MKVFFVLFSIGLMLGTYLSNLKTVSAAPSDKELAIVSGFAGDFMTATLSLTKGIEYNPSCPEKCPRSDVRELAYKGLYTSYLKIFNENYLLKKISKVVVGSRSFKAYTKELRKDIVGSRKKAGLMAQYLAAKSARFALIEWEHSAPNTSESFSCNSPVLKKVGSTANMYVVACEIEIVGASKTRIVKVDMTAIYIAAQAQAKFYNVLMDGFSVISLASSQYRSNIPKNQHEGEVRSAIDQLIEDQNPNY